MLYTCNVLAGGLDFALRKSTVPGIIVVIALLILSSVSWAVMITKHWQLRKARQASAAFMSLFRSVENPLQLHLDKLQMEAAPVFAVFRDGCAETLRQLVGIIPPHEHLAESLAEARKLTPSQWEAVNLTLQRSVGEQSLSLETQTPLLATAVSGAPFLGLLGTVWGVMDTFSGIAESSAAASIKDMAPGVAAALLTTVIGLLVAIPAMFGYNYLVSQIRGMIVGLENFAAEFSAAVHHAFVEASEKGGRPLAFELMPGMTASLARLSAE